VLTGGAAAGHVPRRARRHRGWALAVGVLLAGALGLRLWGIGHGLPYVYNTDENAHFVPQAIGLFGHGLHPHYFVNPPGFTYVLHGLFAAWFGGREAVGEAYATDPTQVFVLARIASAGLGTLAVGLLYLAGARLAGRRVGFLAAALLAVAFLPVFYAHLALNDVPTLAPACLALWGAAGVLRTGRARDYVVAGIGVGLAAGTKYTGGIVLLPLLGAAGIHLAAPPTRAAAVRGLVLAGVAALAGFLLANPFAALDFAEFRAGLDYQSSRAGEAAGKLGATQDSGLAYYGWTLTWGLGWVPALAALAAVPLLWLRDRRLLVVLVPGVVLFGLFMGLQTRYFGRWLLPVFPLLCLLAALAAVHLSELLAAGRPHLRSVLLAAAGAGLLVQGLAASVHSGQVLARPDTRATTRAFLTRAVPETTALAGADGRRVRRVTRVVVEPVVPNAWSHDVGRPSPRVPTGNRWVKFPTARDEAGRPVGIEDYVRTLHPGLLDRYEAEGFCWVVTGSTQRGRAEADPEAVPRAVAYYRELDRRGKVVHVSSPYREGAEPVPFNFDWSFDHYPRAYERPGPLMTVHRLDGGRCAGASRAAGGRDPAA
jgi:4-amino-4-deoxy-L-arabinose transferase-like glycosyltransferase